MTKKVQQTKAKRAKTLTIVSAVILVLTYTAKDMVKERTKDLSDSLRSAEALYRTQSGQTGLSVQDLAYRQIGQINQINQIKDTHPEESERDYSDIIRSDLVTGQQVLGDLHVDFDNTSRFIDKLPSGASDLRQARDQIHKNIDDIDKEVADLFKASPKHDWVRAVGVKLGIVMTATTEIPVLTLGDAVLQRAHQVQEANDKIYGLMVWLSYLLYIGGVALAVYANLSGIRSSLGSD